MTCITCKNWDGKNCSEFPRIKVPHPGEQYCQRHSDNTYPPRIPEYPYNCTNCGHWDEKKCKIARVKIKDRISVNDPAHSHCGQHTEIPRPPDHEKMWLKLRQEAVLTNDMDLHKRMKEMENE